MGLKRWWAMLWLSCTKYKLVAAEIAPTITLNMELLPKGEPEEKNLHCTSRKPEFPSNLVDAVGCLLESCTAKSGHQCIPRAAHNTRPSHYQYPG